MDKLMNNNKAKLTCMLVGGLCSLVLYHIKKKMNFSYFLFSKNWFSEFSQMWPGQAFSLEIKRIIHQAKSKYQSILVFESKTFGNVLILDGVIQLTEKDEFAYHEMMTHVPMTVAKEPKNILVVGGGDGGVIRELCKYKSIENIDICEIDEMVIEVSKTFFKNISCGFDDKRVNVFIEDASKFLENVTNTYDVIIVDSSDPIGPAESLFNQNFYEKVYNALKPNGYCVAQCESIWIHVGTIKSMMGYAKKMFKKVEYANISIPTYPCGCIGILCCSKSDTGMSKPNKRLESKEFNDLKYYSYENHSAAFKLPAFVLKDIESV
ncbi:spermidine synthase, putative [Plasmodium knowlesi strain H]|uniref:Spermidine synthase, putative n=3 Tax=Plasmodium knowlesi TaxID=5850 RepID=A0A5K1UXZ3_PLAKH|nr:spermidine synthase, putative [Plasmodium knowlesi strain H]OTN65205.1 putative Spermidine synthase [Plasmodium knowlesi]CAA9988317.1 spermidine synthase, putative [Plasmodium knowlesi strain H]SBO20214.1 spermidine synthase, putative [Plasmodium knowlesi strain H]VVS77791.1 spermidine synthase, putative [Plasmodium knowlesi strain H]|eukprot:XP_002259296.1 spermidine synthase, putative [Plasmodium knowlesi strain H]